MQNVYVSLDKLKKILKEKDITYKEICQKLEMQEMLFVKKINNHRTFSLKEITVIMSELNIDFYEIVIPLKNKNNKRPLKPPKLKK